MYYFLINNPIVHLLILHLFYYYNIDNCTIVSGINVKGNLK